MGAAGAAEDADAGRAVSLEGPPLFAGCAFLASRLARALPAGVWIEGPAVFSAFVIRLLVRLVRGREPESDPARGDR